MFSVSSLPEHLQKRGLQKKNMREGVRKVLTHIVKKKEKYSVHGKSYDHSICRKIRKNVFFFVYLQCSSGKLSPERRKGEKNLSKMFLIRHISRSKTVGRTGNHFL